MNRVIMHVDANSAFLSWQAVYDLQHGAEIDIREIPAVIGGNQATRHGIVLAKSIPCKQFKIETGEPIVNAREKCPGLTVIPPNYFAYSTASKMMFSVLREFSPRVQIFSIDEGFLDFTGMEYLYGNNPVEIARTIKDKIKHELGFTVSVGVSSNKLLAKMASEFKKPDGVSTCYPDEIKDKMWPLPVRELYGVGRATEEKLHNHGIMTIGDIASVPVAFLKHLFKSYGVILWEFANGIETSAIHQGSTGGNHHTVKGVGNSCTSSYDITENKDAYLTLLSLTETVSMRLRFGGFMASVITVIIRKSDLSSYSHQRKLAAPVDTVEAIFETIRELFDEAWNREPIRGLGVRASDLYTEYAQVSLFEKNWDKQRLVNKTIDEIRTKYGKDSIVRGAFLYSGIAHMQGGLGDEIYAQMSSIL